MTATRSSTTTTTISRMTPAGARPASVGVDPPGLPIPNPAGGSTLKARARKLADREIQPPHILGTNTPAGRRLPDWAGNGEARITRAAALQSVDRDIFHSGASVALMLHKRAAELAIGSRWLRCAGSPENSGMRHPTRGL